MNILTSANSTTATPAHTTAATPAPTSAAPTASAPVASAPVASAFAPTARAELLGVLAVVDELVVRAMNLKITAQDLQGQVAAMLDRIKEEKEPNNDNLWVRGKAKTPTQVVDRIVYNTEVSSFEEGGEVMVGERDKFSPALKSISITPIFRMDYGRDCASRKNESENVVEFSGF
ncbi:hypothetical protein GGX14DRAFT_404738 [Mycena pura]|uniref:Uncharacterized protein n=1 Tax=Mycena pura TaxID=153505 RepID=A0AAD6UV40_9AGAR|nr:hypothetical protein GGX14DRAFT_404738 [Mycena pura]